MTYFRKQLLIDRTNNVLYTGHHHSFTYTNERGLRFRSQFLLFTILHRKFSHDRAKIVEGMHKKI